MFRGGGPGFALPVFSITPGAQASGFGGATALNYGINLVGTGNIGDTVKLPAATGSGKSVIVTCDTAFWISVYPQTGEQINQFGASVAYAVFTRQRIHFIDTAVGKWDFLTNIPLNYPIYFQTAFAGGGQGSATQGGYGTNVISACATDLDSAKLPLAIGGCEPIFYINKTTKIVNLYPDSTAGQNFINDLAANTPVQIGPGECWYFVDIGPSNNQWYGGPLGHPAKAQSTGSTTVTGDYTLLPSDRYIINNKAGSALSVTLPAAASYRGKVITVRTIQGQAVNSASSNVVPRAGGAAGTAIVTGTAGNWAEMVSDGTNWQIMAGS